MRQHLRRASTVKVKAMEIVGRAQWYRVVVQTVHVGWYGGWYGGEERGAASSRTTVTPSEGGCC